MGKRGPRPQPTALKLAKGERRPSRVNRDEPTLPEPTTLRPPKGLPVIAKREWKRLAPLLQASGVLRETDLTCLENYCRAFADLRLFEEKAAELGPELSVAKGFASAVRQLRIQVNQLARELGLTPSSRAAIRVSKQPQHGDDKVNRYLSVLPGGRK
jgi:P27 family predicted phage terminase small subunit